MWQSVRPSQVFSIIYAILTRHDGWGNSPFLQGNHGLDQAHKARSTLAEINSIIAKYSANSRCFARIANMTADAIALFSGQVSTAWNFGFNVDISF